jgi:hypothetical protein
MTGTQLFVVFEAEPRCLSHFHTISKFLGQASSKIRHEATDEALVVEFLHPMQIPQQQGFNPLAAPLDSFCTIFRRAV